LEFNRASLILFEGREKHKLLEGIRTRLPSANGDHHAVKDLGEFQQSITRHQDLIKDLPCISS
jgi:hypothetical protein